MAHITADRVRQISTSTGTGTFVLSSSITGFRTFASVLAVSDTFWYAIASFPGSEWEVGLGTYSAANTITRTTVLASSNAGAAVVFSTGDKEVFITAAASKFLQQDSTGSYGNFTAGTITAALTGNASTATALATSRTLWGQGFTGAANVTGSLTSVGDITGTGAVTLTATAGTLAFAATGANSITASTNGATRLTIDSAGNVTPGVTNTQTLGAVGDVWSNVHATTFTGTGLSITGTSVLASGRFRTWTSADTDIDGLISGSAIGLLAEGANSAHFTVGLRSNDLGDGFQVISKGAATTPDTDPFTTLCFEVKANGNVTWAGTATGTSFNSITGLSSTTPVVAGTAAIGTATTTARADHVHPAQTTISGNAGTATALQTSRTLWGQGFTGAANVTGSLTSVGNITGTGAVTLTATAGTLALTATGANIITATTNGSERVRIDSSGNVGINGTAQVGVSSQTEKLQVLGTDGPTCSIASKRYSAEATGTQIRGYKSRGATVGTDTAVQSGDGLLSINAYGYTGTQYSLAANIGFEADAAPSGSTLQGRIEFFTTDSAGSSQERMRIDSTGLLSFNSGYGSAAPAYGCRAWVNFDGTAAGTFAGGTSTVSRTAGSTTATVTTTTAHGLITGNVVQALTGVAAGTYTVTFLTSTTFTITTVATTVLTAASITFAVNSIIGSGNVSSMVDNGTGDYTINFASALVDANYAVNGTATGGSLAGASVICTIHSTGSAVAPTTKTTTAVRIRTADSDSNEDSTCICVSIIR